MIKFKNQPLVRFFVDNKKYAIYLVLLLLSALGLGFFQSYIAKIMGRIVDYGLALENEQMIRLMPTLGLFLFAESIRNLLNYFISAHSIESIFLQVRNKMFKVITQIPIHVLEKNIRSGDVVSRVNSDIMSLCSILDTYTWYLNLIIAGIVALIMCIFISWQLTLVYVLCLPICMIILKKIAEPLGDLESKKLAKKGTATGMAMDTIRGLDVVKSYSLENRMQERFNKAVDSSVEAGVLAQKTNLKLNFVKNSFNILPLFCVLIAKGGKRLFRVQS